MLQFAHLLHKVSVARCYGEQISLMKQIIPAQLQVEAQPDDESLMTYDWSAPLDHAAERQLQRRAMVSMWLAMLVMALGLPAHLGGHGARGHSVVGHAALLSWLAWLLTTATLWQARELLTAVWHTCRRGYLSETALVALGALAAYAVSLIGLGAALVGPTHQVPLYFDVTAMALAWLLAGVAQRADLRRRFMMTVEQLAPLGLATPVRPVFHPDRPSRDVGWLALLLVGWALLTLALQFGVGQSLGAGLSAALATLALGCPCALGIARSSAATAGAARAAAAGWVVVDEAAFWCDPQSPRALQLAQPVPGSYEQIAGLVRRVAWLNRCWAIGINVLALPLALRGPVDPLLPAGIMLLAWALIALSSRSIGWLAGFGRAERAA